MTKYGNGAKAPSRVKAKDKFNNFKPCKKCGETKRLADFALVGNWRKKRAADPTRYKTKCKACTRALDAVKVDPNFQPKRAKSKPRIPQTASQRRERSATYKRRVRRDTRIRALQFLAEKGCCECGARDPRVLEFDHIEPCDKVDDVGKLLCDGYSWGAEKLREEIRKCRVICANCHRKHTIAQQDHYGHKDVAAALQKIYDDYGIE